MENVLTAIFVIFLILFSAFTLTDQAIDSQVALHETRYEIQLRQDERAHTSLQAVAAWLTSDETIAAFTYRNSGSARLAEFDAWDVILEYTDSADPAVHHISWLDYSSSVPFMGEWSVEGIYIDSTQDVAESIEPGILNPGEEIVLHVKLDPTLGRGQTLLLTVSTANAVSAPVSFRRNELPTLDANDPLSLVSRTSADITSAMLASSDSDHLAPSLVYSIEMEPGQGALNLGGSFTQSDIDSGLLTYTHTGQGDDSFEFMISDGVDSIGPYTFSITVTNAAPQISLNTGMGITSGSVAAITQARLQTSDVDNVAANLVYTVIAAPTQGALSLGAIFTQADIDAGLLTYSHSGTGSDSFSFTVSDGEATIGPFTFSINVS